MVDGLKSFLINYSLIELHYFYIPRLTIWFIQPTRYDALLVVMLLWRRLLIMSAVRTNV
jgi:hypothetical protein